MPYIMFCSNIYICDIHVLYVIYFSENVRHNILCEASAGQMIHMKCQALLALKNNKNKKISFENQLFNG